MEGPGEKGCELGKMTRYGDSMLLPRPFCLQPHNAAGYLTGKKGLARNGTIFCELEGWCPTPEVTTPQKSNVLQGVDEWQMMLSANVKFPKFDVVICHLRLYLSMLLQTCFL